MTINFSSLLTSALDSHADGNLENARFLYEKILNVDSENSKALGWLGVLEAQQKNYLLA